MTETPTIQLQSDFVFAKSPRPYVSFTKSKIAIHVQTECPKLSRSLAWDIATALDHGAAPAAQAVMIDQLAKANAEQRPFSCKMEPYL